jgi:hypothetical protein
VLDSNLREARSDGARTIDFKLKRFTRMRTENAALFAIALLSISFGLHDSARCQTSLAPPLSLSRPPAPSPDEDAPPAIVRASPPTAAGDVRPPKPAAKRSTPPVTARDTPPPKPAADYDGFSTAVEDEPAPEISVNQRAASRSKPRKKPDGIAAQPSDDSAEDEQLKRKLTICRDCK